MQRVRVHPGLVMALASLAATQAAAQTAPALPAGTAAPSSNGGLALRPADVAQPAHPALEQIVVTANKRRELQRRVADSVTAISGRELDRRQEVSLQDLAAQVPGLSLETDDKSAVRVVLRGLNTGSAGATVASLLDEVPTNPAGAQNNASTNTPNFDTYDLQRIEVLRGPQGTLYGATAEGGLIKYVTNPPDLTRYSGGLETSIDGATDGGIGGTLKGFINVPFGDGKAALRLTGWNEWFPGYVDNPEIGKTDTNSGQQYGWRASLLMQPVEDLNIRLTAERQSLFSNNIDNVTVYGAASPGSLALPPPNQQALTDGLRNATALTQPSQNETAVYYANVNYDFGSSNLTSVTAFSFAKFTSLFDASNTNVAPGLPIAGYLQGAAYGVPLVVDERQNSNTDKFSQEVRLASDPGQTLLGRDVEWLGGGYYTHETSAFLQNLDARSASNLSIYETPPPGGANLYGALSEWALFGQVDYHFIPTFDLELGGRWSGNAQHSTSGFACCLLYGPSVNQPTVFSNDHDALYSVAPRWRPTDDTMVYGRIATGYRPGGPNIPIPGVTGLPLTYKPDRTVNYEIGVRQDLFDKTVSVDVTGYYINWKSVQILSLVDTPSGPTGVNGNAGAAVSKGVEWDLKWAPFRGLTLEAVGGYTDARLAVDAPGLGGAQGDFLPYVPDVQNSVNVEYSWVPMDGTRAFASGTWSYTGVRYTSFAPAGGVTESHVRLPGYNTGAVRVGVEHGRYSGEFYVNNIGNSHALAYYANQGGADQTGLATLIAPRIIGLVARVGF